MAETYSNEPHVSVPGMCNTGNTCFLNAALQAMASSQVLCEALSRLAGLLQASSSCSSTGQQDSAAVQLFAAVKAAVKFILHGEVAKGFN
jgi:ubiquitin C-terminal hydrolase